jgi:hypothetical protein
MSLFASKRKNPASIPEPYIRGLRGYGEHLAGQPTNYNSGLTADLTIVDFARRDPDAYVEMLLTHIGGADSGAFCLGAAENAVHVLGLQVTGSAWSRIVDGAAEYLRDLGIPYSRLKPYMQARWTESHSPAEW